MADRKWQPYKEGELEVILSLVPTKSNIEYLASLLDRSESAIKIVYKMAYEKGKFGNNSDVQAQKVSAAKAKLGIDFS